jgi:hypothetical protein
MPEESKPGTQCLEFEARLSEALDGALSGAERNQFEAHRKACASCGPMFAEAQRGMQLLRGLAEVEPPANFVHNILAATVGGAEATVQPARPRESWWEKLRSGLRPALRPVLQPRFAMSFAMVFFSISLVLNFAGVKLGNVRHLDLSPSAIMRGAYEAQARVVKYYENIRFVYEIESRVQELKRATTPEESNPPAEKPKDGKDQSEKPDHRYQNYSREQEAVTLARLFDSAPLADQVFARRNA